MTSLSDQIDRFTRHTRAIKTTASSLASQSSQSSSGPFVRAVLHTHLGDLIREVDSSELGLFTLIKTPPAPLHDRDSRVNRVSEIQRTEFSGATPLRRQPRRDESTQDIEPEIFARAALKYIDRYKPIRAMPRAYAQAIGISDRIKVIRDNIASLNHSMQESHSADPTPIKVLLQDEESNIRRFQEKIESLKKWRLSLIEKAPQNQKLLATPGIRNVSRPPTSPQEDKFWNTPATASRTLNFAENLLMDEDVNIGDISILSFSSPLQEATGSLMNDRAGAFSTPLLFSDASDLPSSSTPSSPSTHAGNGKKSASIVDVKELPSSSQHTDLEPELVKSILPDSGRTSLLEHVGQVVQSEGDFSKIKVNNEVERIAAKIWVTVGDVIRPGHPFTVSSPSRKKHPLARETITYLHQLVQTPSSVSDVSVTSGMRNEAPSSQQVSMAYLLICLLSSPNYCLPLNKLKDQLAEKLNAYGSSIMAHGQSSARIIYGCVAKRLVRIDRETGEQMVKFDV
ncbi:hypothetical protein BDQ17DRAFT_1350342 [Cyathus striatus]|nr:hypothetical protein BDQ17DRAFT_1350342 [Cyathus striatus]